MFLRSSVSHEYLLDYIFHHPKNTTNTAYKILTLKLWLVTVELQYHQISQVILTHIKFRNYHLLGVRWTNRSSSLRFILGTGNIQQLGKQGDHFNWEAFSFIQQDYTDKKIENNLLYTLFFSTTINKSVWAIFQFISGLEYTGYLSNT